MIKLKNLLLEVINNILIIDVESTCGEDMSEIIEIGMADTNDISYPSIIIMPEFSNVTPLCTSLTTLTPEQIKDISNQMLSGENSLRAVLYPAK